VGLFVYRIGREIGSLAAALGGLDALVFTAGIGENSPEIRARICAGLEWTGLALDAERNAASVNGAAGLISRDGARLAAWVIPTDEELMIARDTVLVVHGLDPSDEAGESSERRS
jgi:acetate kinase